MRFVRRRILIRLLLAVVLVTMAALAGGGWYLSDKLRDGALVVKRTPPTFDLGAEAGPGLRPGRRYP